MRHARLSPLSARHARDARRASTIPATLEDSTPRRRQMLRDRRQHVLQYLFAA